MVCPVDVPGVTSRLVCVGRGPSASTPCVCAGPCGRDLQVRSPSHHQERSLLNYLSKLDSRGLNPPVQCQTAVQIQSAPPTHSLASSLPLCLSVLGTVTGPQATGWWEEVNELPWYREPQPAHSPVLVIGFCLSSVRAAGCRQG